MERATPVRKPHTSTSDLLTWSEAPPPEASSSAGASRSAARSNQPSDGIGKVLFGGQITDEEAESLNKRRSRKWGESRSKKRNKNKSSNPDDVNNSENCHSDIEEDSNDSVDGPDTSSFTAFLYSLLASSESRSNSNFEEKIDSDDNPFKPSSEPTVTRENAKKKSLFSRGKQSLGKAFSQAAKLGIPMQTLNESPSPENLPETSEPSLLSVKRLGVSFMLHSCDCSGTKMDAIIQGSNNSFVFTNTSGHPLIFRPTGSNSFISCLGKVEVISLP
ncbi:hypothetical protein Sango_1893100 [Sesamum angolense]|uniref:DUF4057 domain-containing protein n=1 Tax=Sesamum angolense TaxID=2727404 RepID=A0AAE1WIP8_9LAMI|nr:hypothetical protein Sango_1893100 [Sesamum angolense]